jgi:hypothetical protein
LGLARGTELFGNRWHSALFSATDA